ncbi:MAG: DUF4230 domain-containing protein [Janthinobacterium lividum]
MGAGGVRANIILALIVGLVTGVGLGTIYAPSINQTLGRDPDGLKTADAVLLSIQNRRRLVVFAARFAVSHTAHRDTLLGYVNANKTLTLPGTMRYELDWGKLKSANLIWDKANRQLTVMAPDVEIAGPDIEVKRTAEYRDGSLILAMTNVEKELDLENRRSVDAKFVSEARNPIYVEMARRQARDAIRETFLLPLLAVGISAPNVVVRLPSDRN